MIDQTRLEEAPQQQSRGKPGFRSPLPLDPSPHRYNEGAVVQSLRINTVFTQGGFSLIELAVVLVIIGTLLTLGIAAFNAQSTSSAYTRTKVKMEVIRDALINHLGKHGFLPCPDTNFDGRGNRSLSDGTPADANPVAACNARAGLLPYIDLELPRDAALDGWENFFLYHVAVDNFVGSYNSAQNPDVVPTNYRLCDESNPAQFNSNRDWTRRGCFFSGNAGNIPLSVKDASDNVLQSTSAAVLILSHGLNGLGAYTTKGTQNEPPDFGSDEYANTQISPSDSYVMRPITDDTKPANPSAGEPYDDLLTHLAPSELLAPLRRQGLFLWEQSKLMADEAAIADAVLTYAMTHRSQSAQPSHNCYEYAMPDSDSDLSDSSGLSQYLSDRDRVRHGIDSWGTPYRYERLQSSLRYNTNADLYRIISKGFDRVDSTCTLDDICAPVGPAYLKSRLQWNVKGAVSPTSGLECQPCGTSCP